MSLSSKSQFQTSHSGQQLSIGWLGLGTAGTQVKINYSKIQYELDFKTQEFSIVSKWGSLIDSLSLGYGAITSGTGSATVSGVEYQTTTVSGSTMHLSLGWEFWGMFEFLLGYRQEDAAFKNFSYGSTTLSEPVQIKPKLLLIGLGFSF